ncbi:MAG TPA: hypothetical protein PKI14_04425 [Fervidobacterium sp.]|nr:hypothetical protein [Fervidobacterium sp.]
MRIVRIREVLVNSFKTMSGLNEVENNIHDYSIVKGVAPITNSSTDSSRNLSINAYETIEGLIRKPFWKHQELADMEIKKQVKRHLGVGWLARRSVKVGIPNTLSRNTNLGIDIQYQMYQKLRIIHIVRLNTSPQKEYNLNRMTQRLMQYANKTERQVMKDLERFL